MEQNGLLEEIRYTYIGRDGTVESRCEEVLVEHSLQVYINGLHAGKITCIPEHLDILVLGRLLTEGIISSASDVAGLCLTEKADRIDIRLTGSGILPTGQTLLRGNSTGNDGYIVAEDMEPVVPIPWKPEWIFALADHFAAGTPLHEKTWATHSCILASEGKILFTCEDISRHNALDKVIGYALQAGIDLSGCMVYCSGRIPTDMAAKAIRARIPVMASKASPTTAAVRLAEKCRLTLICAARKDRMKLFSGSIT